MSKVGQLRHPITLQSQGTSRDSGGGVSSGFSDIATVYADIRPKNGKEVYKQGKLIGSVTPVSYTHLTLPTSDLV